MTRLIAGLAASWRPRRPSGRTRLDRFVGEWKTTMGPVTIERKGDELTGKIVFYKLPLQGEGGRHGADPGLRRGADPR